MRRSLPQILLVVVVLCLNGFNSFGQQAAQFSQYSLTKLAYNPAHTGSVQGVNLEAAFRAQWVGIEGRPLSQLLGVHMPVAGLKSGIGMNLSNDMLGAYRSTSIQLSYAYIQKLGSKSNLAIGIQAGINQDALKGDELITPEGFYGDGIIEHNDALLSTATKSRIVPDLNFGLRLELNNLEVGLSATHLLEPEVKLPSSEGTASIKYVRNYFANIQYKWDINKRMDLVPSVLFKTDALKYQLDTDILLRYNDYVQGGLGFRGLEPDGIDALVVFAGMQVTTNLLLSYSYDFNLSSLRQFNSGSHEIIMHYNLSNLLPTQQGKARYNPRDL